MELLRGGGTNKMLGARRDLLAQLGYQPLLWPKLRLQMPLLSCAANLSLAFARRFRDHHGLPRGRSGMLLGRNLLFLAQRTLLIVYSAFLLALHARLSTPSSLNVLHSIRPLPFSAFC
jgi:hypothetical protein